MKILFVVERPTQFEAPFFRVAAADPGHTFEVLFTRPAPGGSVHDPELGRTVSWGIDLTSGYPWAAPVLDRPPDPSIPFPPARGEGDATPSTDRPLNPSIPFPPARGEGDATPSTDRPPDPSIPFPPARGEGDATHPAPAGAGSIEMGAWRRARWVAREVRRRRPDLVIVNGYTQREYLAAALAARLAGIPAALRIDSVLFPGDKRPAFARRLIVRFPLAGLFRLFLTTGTLGRRYLEGCGIAPERISLFPYAVDVEHFREGAALSPEERRRRRDALGIPETARTVLALAKFSAREAPWDLLRAFCSLPGEDLRLVLGGDGPERAALEELATRHEPGDGTGRVFFPGYIPYPELPALYGISDLFVHPAAEERWGVSVAEALAAGLPVVASTRVGAAHDLVSRGENGALYPAGDAPRLARVLEEVLRLDPAAVADHNRTLLAAHDYRSTWKGLVEAAARTGEARYPPSTP